MICNSKVRVRRLQIWGEEPRELEGKKIFFKKSETMPAGQMEEDGFKKVDRFGNGDRFGSVDWDQYHKTGHLFEVSSFPIIVWTYFFIYLNFASFFSPTLSLN